MNKKHKKKDNRNEKGRVTLVPTGQERTRRFKPE